MRNSSVHITVMEKSLLWYLIKTFYVADMAHFPHTTRLYERLCWLFQLVLFLTRTFNRNRELRQLFKNFHAFPISYYLIFNVKQKRGCFTECHVDIWSSKIDKNGTIKVFHATLLYFPPLHLNSNFISHLHRFKMARHSRLDVSDAKL